MNSLAIANARCELIRASIERARQEFYGLCPTKNLLENYSDYLLLQSPCLGIVEMGDLIRKYI